MASIETIRRITIEARASGVEQATARLNDATRAISTMEGAVTRARRAYDPLFTATERLAAVQRTATLAVAAGNLTQDEANRLYDQAANKLTGYGRELEKVTRLEIQARAAQEASARAAAQANQQTLNSRFGIGTVPGRDAVGDFTAAANAADNLRARYSPLFAVQRQYLAALTEIKDASRAGILTENERAAALERTKAAFAAQVTTMRSGQAGGGGLQAYQAQNLLYQGSDIISSLGSGVPLSTVALQQGPQIAQVFAGPGGASVKGAFAAAMEAASGLAARVGIVGGVLGGVATAAAAAAAAGLSYANSQRETEKALLGVGRASGVTTGQIADLAAANASAGAVSTRLARELATGYASTGRIGGEIIAGLIRNTKDFAATTGQDVPDAARMLAEAFADPAKGADALNERLGFLNDTTRETIQRLQAQGDRLAAQRALMEAYTGSLTKASDTMSGWGRVTEAVGTTIGDIWDKIGRQIDRVVTGGSLEEQIAAARRTLSNAQVAAEGGFGLFSSKDVERAQAALDKLEAQAAKIRAMSDQKEAARNSLVIGNLIRSTQPDQAEIKGLQDKIEQLKKAISDPTKFNLDLAGLWNANNAVGTLSRSFQALTEDVDKFGSRAVAAMNRTADLANRTVGFSASARAAAEIKDRFDQLERTADSRELAGLRRARSVELDTLQRTTYQTTGSYRTNIRDVPDAFRDRIYQAAIGQGLDPSFLASVAAQESGNFNPRVVSGQKRSTAGAIGLMQFMPGTAAQYGIDPTNPGQSIDAAALYLRRSLDKRNGNEALALADYNAGRGRVNSVGGDISRLPAETQNYIAKILTATPQATELAKAQQARVEGLENEQRNLDIANRLLGRNGEAYDAATRAQQMLADAERQGIPVTDAYRAQIERVAGGMAAANRALADTRLGRDLEFERDQLGRSAGDQSAFARARAAFGDTTSDPARAAIGRIREIDMMKEARGTFQDTFGGVVSSLSRGATAASAFSQVITRVADKMINVGTDAVGGLLFGGGGKGGGGSIFGGLISSLAGGAGGIDIGASSWMPKFADGGMLSGAGGPRSDNLLVRASPGEYIVNAESTSKYRSMLDAINSGSLDSLHRFAEGGVVPYGTVGDRSSEKAYGYIPPSGGGQAMPQGGSMSDNRQYSFDLRGSNLTEAQVQVALTRAIAANNQEQDRTQFERSEAYRRMAG